MADYVWARDGRILGAVRVAGTDANEVETLPTRAIQRYLDKGLIALKDAPVAAVANLWQSNGDASAIIPTDNADSWVVGSDRADYNANDLATRARAFFVKAKGAFRAGFTSGTSWDSASVGNFSFASGFNTRASGSGSFAAGSGSIASGSQSFAEGNTSTASGLDSHAEGNSTTASGDQSHAEGLSAIASAIAAHAEGHTTTASGSATHAEGLLTIASGFAAHAQGLESVASRRGQSSSSGGRIVTAGDAQIAEMALSGQTLTATAVALAAGKNSDTPGVDLTGQLTSVLTIPVSRAYTLKVSAVARRTDVQGQMAGFTWEGLVGRDSSGSARIIGVPIEASWSDTGAAAWDMLVAIDTTDATSNYVKVSALGEAAKTIRWVAKLEWTEVGG